MIFPSTMVFVNQIVNSTKLFNKFIYIIIL